MAHSRLWSDHSPLSLSTKVSDYGPSPFKFFSSWLNMNGIDEIVSNAVVDYDRNGRPDIVFMNILRNVKHKIKAWRLVEKEKESAMQVALEDECFHLETLAELGFINELEHMRWSRCKNDLKLLEHVMDRLEWRDGRWSPIWDWLSHPASCEELDELDSCINTINSVQFCGGRDRWIWGANSNGNFDVKSIRRLCIDNRNHDVHYVLKWSNWVPIKVNILAWKVQLGRVPTMDVLEKKGIRTHCPWCVNCGEFQESALHLFSSCFVATMLWQGVSSWCKVSPIYAFSITDLLDFHRMGSWNHRKKEAIHAIILTTIWSIWKMRNDAVFNRRKSSHQKIFKEIQALSFFWVKHRAKWETLSWEDWQRMWPTEVAHMDLTGDVELIRCCNDATAITERSQRGNVFYESRV
ncbi:hypothetical protein E3N88_07662 [Mikania micrantha]|uniref:Reverse transcriptase zinc-binding domain-containing protein n=1 Tax=Mikania micrantha TaxID=192012 RepID=A0A5N6PF32_9ASTR|nr:hypothetical protein E3N88_07662 [Mikania micrantha]